VDQRRLLVTADHGAEVALLVARRSFGDNHCLPGESEQRGGTVSELTHIHTVAVAGPPSA
jgi:hypothetical protein